MKSSAKKIGILGGVGPQATEVLYHQIIGFAQSKYGAENNDDFPRVVIESVPVPDFISDKDNMGSAKKMLIEGVKALTASGATRIAIASNTVHLLLDDLASETNVEFISMIDLVAKRCQELGFKKVGIVGTPVTLESGMYNDKLNEVDILVELPNEQQTQICNNIIRGVIAGKQDGDDRQAYIDTLSDLMSRGSEGVILACTELPLAINYEALGNKAINSMDVLAEGLVDYYYKD